MADPLHGVTLKKIVTDLVDAYGFDGLATHVPLHCFQNDPSIDSSLKLLRRTPWARAKVESFYLFHLRKQAPRTPRDHTKDLRGATGLVLQATKGVMNVVEEMHTTIGAVPIVTDLTYRAIRGVTGVVETGVDAVVSALAPVLGGSPSGPQREALLAALNGVLGDHLEVTENPLAIEMSLLPPLSTLHRGGALLVVIHGSSMNDLQWTRDGHDHGRALARDLGFTPVYAHYNSGRHISTNGKDLAALLEQECAAFDDVTLLGHSMGGLVARAAIHAADQAGHGWRRKLRALVTLGTPHHGAPAERVGNLVDHVLGSTKYSAPLKALGQIRSAGVTDLRFGNVTDADWQNKDRFLRGPDPRTPTPLPEDVRCYAVAATRAATTSPAGARTSDGIVPIDSALGKHPEEAFTLRFTGAHVVTGAKHLDLLSRADVYETIRGWLTQGREQAGG